MLDPEPVLARSFRNPGRRAPMSFPIGTAGQHMLRITLAYYAPTPELTTDLDCKQRDVGEVRNLIRSL
jgi:hypothetical protein